MSYINKIRTDGTTHLIEPTLFAVATGTASAYTAAIDTNFTLVERVVVYILLPFTNAAGATLNISGTGAKNIRYEGSNIAAGVLDADRIYPFVCTKTNDTYYWDLIHNLLRDDRVEIVDMMEAT